MVYKTLLKIVDAIPGDGNPEEKIDQRRERRKIVVLYAKQVSIRSGITGNLEWEDKFLEIGEGFAYLVDSDNNSE